MEPLFPQFRHLPAELRCAIWRFAVPRRNVPVKLKMDLDTWNAATEWDSLLIHYRVVHDGQAPPLPSVGLVNHEAHDEIMKHYKPLQLRRNAVKRALRNHEVDDTAFDTIRGSSRISLFHLECDVLEWRAPQHWLTNYQVLYPLFVAACLSVRHVSIYFQDRLHPQIMTIALAVLDEDQPLQTLTTIMGRPPERVFHYRVARRPSQPEAFQTDIDDVRRILSQYSV
ncbi:hypothetical protein F5Y05DRAFT_376945 [Hypoxylon sp. FL0543]|nr:hypothetical protein F5Y05DRAFT_376945 [Hypoxylon sp. FL0543]